MVEAHTAQGNCRSIELDEAGVDALRPIPAGQTECFVETRRRIFSSLATIGGYDVTEMAIAANATGLVPDMESLHCPILRISEIPQVMCPKEGGFCNIAAS